MDEEATFLAVARDMVPRLRQRAAESDALGMVHPDTMAELHAAGLFRILVPRAYGGYEGSLATSMALALELGRGCVSTAWVFANNSLHNLMLGYLPRQAQDEFWGNGNGHRLLATGAKARWAKCEPVPGGYHLSGLWEFNSGYPGCDGLLVVASVDGRTGPGGMPEMRQFLVYKHEYKSNDDWNAFGLRATCSSSGTIPEPIFIPEHRTAIGSDAHRVPPEGGKPVPQGNGGWDSTWYKIGMFTWVPLTVAPALIGGAQAAVDITLERLQKRTNFIGEKIKDTQSVQLRVAEAQIKVNMAKFLVLQDGLYEMQRYAEEDRQPDVVLRGKWRGNAAYAALLIRDAVNSLQYRGGTQTIMEPDYVGRLFRDVIAGTAHVATDWDICGTIYGKSLLGIDVNLPIH